MKHVKAELTEYLDDALGAAERERVDAHLKDCADCRAELDALKRVSKLVSELPDHELPPGFHARLRNKRFESERKGYTPLAWLPMPARLAAFAACALVVGLVFFQQVRYRLAPSMLAGADADMEEAEQMAQSDAARYRLAQEARQKSLAMARKGTWEGVMGKSAPAARGFAAGAAPGAAGASAPRRARLRPGGVPMTRSAKTGMYVAAPTNESIYRFLREEKARMGIQEIVPPGMGRGAGGARARNVSQEAGDVWNGVPDRPLSREEATTAMRLMTQQLATINARHRWERAPTVPMEKRHRETVLLLGKEEESKPLQVSEEKKADVEAKPMPQATREMLGLAGEVRPMMSPAVPAGPQPQLAEARRKPSKVLKLSWKREWSGVQGGMGEASGAVIKAADYWKDLHERVPFAKKLPELDTSKEMAVAVFGQRSEEQSRSVEISSISIEDGRLMIRFRIKTDPSGKAVKPTAPYHIVVLDRVDLPFTFTQVP